MMRCAGYAVLIVISLALGAILGFGLLVVASRLLAN